MARVGAQRRLSRHTPDAETTMNPSNLRPFRLLCAVGGLLLAAALPAAAGPVFLGAHVTVDAAARAGWLGSAAVDSHTQVIQAPAGTQQLSAWAYSADSNGPGEASARSDLEAVWTDAAHGTVRMSTMVTGHDMVQGTFNFNRPIEDGWFYRFQTGADSVFSLRYDVQVDAVLGGAEYSNGFIARISSALTTHVLPVGQSGQLDFQLQAGEIYELMVMPVATQFVSHSGSMRQGQSGYFQWAIEDLVVPTAQTVPEPAGLALVVSAALAAAACGRSRRRGPCAATR